MGGVAQEDVRGGPSSTSFHLRRCAPSPSSLRSECPNCQGKMRMIATIMKAEVVALILDAHGLPVEAPFIVPCRGPPATDLFEVWWT